MKSFSSDFVGSVGNSGQLLVQENLFSDGNNVAYINQLGDYNSVVLTQYGSGLWGIIDLEGNYNEATLNQSGNHLLSMLKLEGDYNSMDFDQSGSYNGAFFYLEGTGLNFSAMQNDQGIQLMQSGSTIPLSIQHSGRSVPIIISNQ